MKDLIFIIEDAEEGGYFASALGESIITQAETLEELQANIQDAIRCHFEEHKV